ncbi:MAG: FHA domain-containing protein [Planctomycetes bacterium]|nr:FHA domain-containing protein [Planctomycetota bacterium]
MPVLKLRIQGREDTVPLSQDIVILGRSTENAVYVDDRQASRNHCQVEKFAGGWKVVDLASRNGTRVNGVSVNQHVLKSGDRIEIGDAVVTFVDAPDETDARIPGVPKAITPPAPGGRVPSTGVPTPPLAPVGSPMGAGYAQPPYPNPPAPPPPYPPPYPQGAPPQYPQPYPYPPYGAPQPPPQGYVPPPLDPPTTPFGHPGGGAAPPPGYPAPYPPAGAPGYPGYPPPAAPGQSPVPSAHPSQAPADRKSHRSAPVPVPSGSNPGIIIGAAIVLLAVILGAAMIFSDRGGGGKPVSSWQATLDKGAALYHQGKYDEASEEFRKIPSNVREYANARTYLGDIMQRRKADADAAAANAASSAWEALKPRVKKYEDGDLPTADETALRDDIRHFLEGHGAAPEAVKAKDVYVKLGGKPEDVANVGAGTPEKDLSKESQADWARLGQRVEMFKKGDLPADEVDRLKNELRNFVVRYSKYNYPEVADAQQALRGLGRDPGPGPDVGPTPGGDPKNFGELKRLVDGLAGSSSYGEAVGLLDAWIKKDPTGPDAAPADQKIRDVKASANNWYLGQEAQADTLAKDGKFKDARDILDDAVKKLGEKWFFENVAAARKKIAGLEKAMGGGK